MLSISPAPEAPHSPADMALAMAGEMRAKAATYATRRGPRAMLHARLLLALAALVESLARLFRAWQEGQLPPQSPREDTPRPAAQFPTGRAQTWHKSPRTRTTPKHPDSVQPQAARAIARPDCAHPARTMPCTPNHAPSPEVRAIWRVQPIPLFKNAKRAGCPPTPFSFRYQFVPSINPQERSSAPASPRHCRYRSPTPHSPAPWIAPPPAPNPPAPRTSPSTRPRSGNCLARPSAPPPSW